METVDNTRFTLYLDEEKGYPVIRLRVRTKTMDKCFTLKLDQARKLGGGMVTTANKAMAISIGKRGSIVGPL
jgi:hypothetical protein